MKKHPSKATLLTRVSLATLIAILSGCGGGGGGGSSTSSNTTSDSSNSNSSSNSSTTTNSEGETISAQTVGIAVPSEISAVPADTSGSSTTASLKSKLMKLARAAAVSELPTTSDYAQANPSVYVEERALEQFDVIEQVFGALAQTHYADEDNVNAGPYVAMISWEENQNGKDVKQLQEWTVESRMIVVENMPSDVTGNTTGDVNKLLAWIPERDRDTGEEELIKAEFLIYTAPTAADDGSLLDYGEWDMNVLMAASATGVDTIPSSGAQNFFAASARIGSNGESTLKVHDRFTEEFSPSGTAVEFSEEMRGILVRDGTNGYGKVSYPDWETCFRGGPGEEGGDGEQSGNDSNPCANGVPTNVAQYAYNSAYLGVQEINNGTAADAVYKDRNLSGAIRIIHEYDLFYADADADAGIAEGDNIGKHKSFGFPVNFTSSARDDDSITFEEFAFYGAWQGRHQLWGPGDSITATTDGSDGTTLTRADVRPGVEAATYKLKEFNGTFTKRALVNAELADIQGLAVETWLNDHYDLFYFTDANGDGDTTTTDVGWYYCSGEVDWSSIENQQGPACRTKGSNNTNIAFTALAGADGQLGSGGDDAALVSEMTVSENERRWVNIDSCNENGCQQYVYLSSDPNTDGFSFSGAGFYQANWGDQGILAPVTPAAKLTEQDGMGVSVNIGGSVYISYVGTDSSSTSTGWVVKELTGFDQSTWTPTFSETGDREFTPDRGTEYYMNTNGQNYVVTRIGDDATQASSYRTQLELQIAANPANTLASSPRSILPANTSYLAMPWNNTVRLRLVEDASSGNYLLLEVIEDSSGNLTADSVYTEDSWGLTAYNTSNQPLDADGNGLIADEWGWVDPQDGIPVQFNYEYVGNDGDSWGKQQFLVAVDSSNTLGDYIILSDPISLVGVTLFDNLGDEVSGTVSLQYDGWMHGLPSMYYELERNGWSIEGLGDKVRRLTEGQRVTDSEGTNYFVKPMETSLFLGVVTAFPNGDQPNIGQADNVDLSTVPDYTHHEMGATPTTDADGNPIEVKYSEGIPLTSGIDS